MCLPAALHGLERVHVQDYAVGGEEGVQLCTQVWFADLVVEVLEVEGLGWGEWGGGGLVGGFRCHCWLVAGLGSGGGIELLVLVCWLTCAVGRGWWLTWGGSGGVEEEVVVGFGLCNFMFERITGSLLIVVLGLPGSGDTRSGVTRSAIVVRISTQAVICTLAFLRR